MDKHLIRVAACAAFAVAIFSGVRTAFAQVGADGIDWVTVGAVNNSAYDGPDVQGIMAGRGSVPYEYRIGRTEITTSQWVEFINTFKARADPVPQVVLERPAVWGAERDPTYTGPGTRYRLNPNLPNAGMVPVGGLDWRTAARYANWLCNDKSSARSAIDNGAYDASTFGESRPGVYTDQAAHTPGARYWIPTLDEWMKAAYFDPNGNGTAQGRWWQQPNGGDTPLMYGPPPGYPGGSPLNQANAGFELPGLSHLFIPLGSYPSVVSPWGLLDVAGGTTEWMETMLVDPGDGRNWRFQKGSRSGGGGGNTALDVLANGPSADIPVNAAAREGFRIASSVPGPGMMTMLVGIVTLSTRRRRCSINQESSSASSP